MQNNKYGISCDAGNRVQEKFPLPDSRQQHEFITLATLSLCIDTTYYIRQPE